MKTEDDSEENILVAQPFFIQPAFYPPVVANPQKHYEFQNEDVVSPNICFELITSAHFCGALMLCMSMNTMSL